MKQKIWVIDDLGTGEGPAKKRPAFQSEKSRTAGGLLPKFQEKNPALSFSFSMLVWGSGHLYIREYIPALIFMASMFFFYSAVLVVVFLWDSISLFVSGTNYSASIFVIGAAVFLIAGLFLWLFNAVHAYYRTEKLRWAGFFQGVDNEFWPLCCSLLFPGWGQFLNGQAKKGLFFMLFGMIGTFSVIVLSSARQVWPLLNANIARVFFELCFAVALVTLPLCLLLWIVAVHDAFWSCREPVRKRPLLKRFQYFRERAKTHGAMRALMPKIRTAAIFGLLFTASILAGRYYFPTEYYRDSLASIRMEMLSSDMEITAELIQKAIVFIER